MKARLKFLSDWSRAACLLGALGVAQSFAASNQEEPPFDDLPDLSQGTKAPTAPAPETPKATPAVKATPPAKDVQAKASPPSAPAAPKAKEAAPSPPADDADVPPSESTSAKAAPPAAASAAAVPATPNKAPEAAPPAAATAQEKGPDAPATPAPKKESFSAENLTPAENDVPEDVKALDEKLNGKRDPKIPQNLSNGTPTDDNLVSTTDPGTALAPSDQFFRVPLRPPMSDASWRRYAGPVLEKNYRLRSGDTLWSVSQRLFGSPYLWPKVWELNAQIGNPNLVRSGTQLLFYPGNPNSAPELAFQDDPSPDANIDVPLDLGPGHLSLAERVEYVLKAQTTSHPPFLNYASSHRPKNIADVEPLEDDQHLYFTLAQRFHADCDDGTYPVVRSERLGMSAYKIQWLGNVRVKAKIATVIDSFGAIQLGDTLTDKTLQIPALSLHEEQLGKWKSSSLLPVEEGAESYSSERRMLGVKFRSAGGPQPGAVMNLIRSKQKVATVLLLDRDNRVGTFWILDNKEEINLETDQVE